MSAPHPTAIDTADPAPLRIFRDTGKAWQRPLSGFENQLYRQMVGETESEVMQNEHGRSGLDQRPPAHLGADRLAEIATLIRLLTYGEMMELSKSVADIIAGRPIEIASLTDEVMADVLHKWSKER